MEKSKSFEFWTSSGRTRTDGRGRTDGRTDTDGPVWRLLGDKFLHKSSYRHIFFTEIMKRFFLGVPRGCFVENFKLNRSRTLPDKVLFFPNVCFFTGFWRLWLHFPMITPFESASQSSNFGTFIYLLCKLSIPHSDSIVHVWLRLM